MTRAVKRRGRGEGGITERADGLWCASVSKGTVLAQDGSKRRNRKYVYGVTKRAVQEKLADLLRQRPGEAGSGFTLAAYLDQWLAHVRPTIEPGTFIPYDRHCKRIQGLPLASTPLGKLTAQHIKAMYPALTIAGISPAMQRKIGTTLTIALNEAVQEGLLPYNPAASIRKPKAAKKEIRPLDPQQVNRFLTEAKSDRLFAFYVLALDTGMRPGEMFALQWENLDLVEGYVVVNKSLEQIGDKQRVKECKTLKGNRRIDLSRRTVAALKNHRKRMEGEGFISGPIFCNTIGGYIRISDLHRTSFKPILKWADLPNIRLYDLRHTSATLLLLADVSAKVVSERLGHSGIQITLDTYSHVLPTMQKRAAEMMDKILKTR